MVAVQERGSDVSLCNNIKRLTAEEHKRGHFGIYEVARIKPKGLLSFQLGGQIQLIINQNVC